MPLDLTNLEASLQSRVDALGADADEKNLLLLSKAIEAAVGNVGLNKILCAVAKALVDVQLAGAEQAGLLDAAAVAKIAAIGALDAVPKTGGTMTGPLIGTSISMGSANFGNVSVLGNDPAVVLHELDGAANAKRWDAIALGGKLAFRILDDLSNAAKTWLEVGRTGVSAAWVRFTTAVIPNVVPVTWASTITLDLLQGNKFPVTLAGTTTFANPVLTAEMVGMEFAIVATQDGSGNRAYNFGSVFRFQDGVAPAGSTTGGKRDRIMCEVVSTTAIDAVLVKGF